MDYCVTDAGTQSITWSQVKTRRCDSNLSTRWNERRRSSRLCQDASRILQRWTCTLPMRWHLYGLHTSPRAFWQYLVEKMEACGMKQSQWKLVEWSNLLCGWTCACYLVCGWYSILVQWQKRDWKACLEIAWDWNWSRARRWRGWFLRRMHGK